jgi:DNA topoisomerase IB
VSVANLLVIPPAWEQVWICPVPNGHLQAVGIDDAGRRQYLYHEQWRLQRDRLKHDKVLEVAARLPSARRTVARHLKLEGMPYQRALEQPPDFLILVSSGSAVRRTRMTSAPMTSTATSRTCSAMRCRPKTSVPGTAP